MSTHSPERVVPLEDRLNAIPAEMLHGQGRDRMRELCRDLDRLARQDQVTQEIYIHEPTLRALMRKHTPDGFAEGYLRMMKQGPQGNAVRDSHPGRNDTPVRLEAAFLAAGLAKPGERPEAVGLTANSSLADLRNLCRSHGDLPEFMFEPGIGDKLQQVVHQFDQPGQHLSEAAVAGVAPAPPLAPNYWDRVTACFQSGVGSWGSLAVMVFIWTFFTIWPVANPDPVSACIAALIVAGIFIAVRLLWNFVWCLVAALFG